MVKDPRQCVSLGPIIGTRIGPNGAEAVHQCKNPSIKETTWPQCQSCEKFSCKQNLTSIDKKSPNDLLVNQNNQPLLLSDTWKDGHLFLTLSGPSLNKIPFEVLSERGIVTFAVNNAATIIRPTFWVYGDKGTKFHNVIWEDPGIMKFMPVKGWNPKHPHMVRVKRGDGTFEVTDKQGRFRPGVVGYQRNATFNPAEFLYEPTCNWGNSEKSAEKNGLPHILNIMFVVLRISFYLGFRNVYLLGCDFTMDDEQPYAFNELKNPKACASNNGTYLKLNHMLSLLKPYFDEAGFNVFNCTPKSGLRTFPQLSFKEAIHNAKQHLPSVIDTIGWYD